MCLQSTEWAEIEIATIQLIISTLDGCNNDYTF